MVTNHRHHKVALGCLLVTVFLVPLKASDPGDPDSTQPPYAQPKEAPRDGPVRWNSLNLQAGLFLGLQHGVRLATEPGTRAGMKGPFFQGWYDSLSALHGWGDGDPFLVNYIGHPMQGSVAGFIWNQNDPKFQMAEFGSSAHYWKSRLRATAFSWLYSTQFEIGPISEASIGKIQSRYPQQGFVDHVATPTLGAVWMIGEDALDRFVIRPFEDRVNIPWMRVFVRGGLNPSRSFANMLRFKVPWHRDTRAGAYSYLGPKDRASATYSTPSKEPSSNSANEPWNTVAPFEFTSSTLYSVHPDGAGGTNCIGGLATAVWNRTSTFSWVAEVGGCKLFNFEPGTSGDILTYMVGPRWTRRGGRFQPYGQFLVGGKRATLEIQDIAKREEIRAQKPNGVLGTEDHPYYATQSQSNGFAVAAGAGVEMGISRTFSWRVAALDYSRAWVPMNTPSSYPHSIRLSSGIVLRVGTW